MPRLVSQVSCLRWCFLLPQIGDNHTAQVRLCYPCQTATLNRSEFPINSPETMLRNLGGVYLTDFSTWNLLPHACSGRRALTSNTNFLREVLLRSCHLRSRAEQNLQTSNADDNQDVSKLTKYHMCICYRIQASQSTHYSVAKGPSHFVTTKSSNNMKTQMVEARKDRVYIYLCTGSANSCMTTLLSSPSIIIKGVSN